jgi:4-diphosphocytidyl-2-C-methyl-D-erythritol kinase
MSASIINSCAKINVGLKIVNKREDGFHNLETIFYPVKLHDTLAINITPTPEDHNSVRIHSNKSYVPTDKKNICYKTIEHFFVEFNIKSHFFIEISIDKHIPVGGGLGGGSSNSAAIIKHLVKYFNINIAENREKLLKVALDCGSDVPFFMVMKPCFAEGRGEKMKILKDFKLDYNILLVNPNIHVSTKWAFEHLNYTVGEIHPSELRNVTSFDPSKPGTFKNDFEEPIFSKYPELAKVKQELLDAGAVFASMSGTGATMYGLFARDNMDAFKKCRREYERKGYFVSVG